MVTVAVSGYYDPLHSGHLDNIRKARVLGDRLVVIIGRDDQLVQKKGYVFMPLLHRKAIIEALRDVDEVVVNRDEDTTCADTLLDVWPDIYAKGGDRTLNNMPECEINICDEIGCEIAYGVGNLMDSSQAIVRRCMEDNEFEIKMGSKDD